MLVNKIHLYDDKMTVLCNTRDGHFDVDLEEMSSLKGQLERTNTFEELGSGLGKPTASPAQRVAVGEEEQRNERAYSSAASEKSRIAPLRGDSEFLQAIDGKDSAAVWSVMDELMDTLRVVNGKVYDSVLRKIRNL